MIVRQDAGGSIVTESGFNNFTRTNADDGPTKEYPRSRGYGDGYPAREQRIPRVPGEPDGVSYTPVNLLAQ